MYCAPASPWSAARRYHFTRLGVVLRHALAIGVHEAEIVLRAGVALVGGEAIPLQRPRRSSAARPRPLSYMTPRLYCASASPWSAARRYHFRASA